MINPDVESVSWLRVVLAIAIVSGLICLMSYGLKYATTHGLVMPRMSKSKRLKLVETLVLDGRRRLVIVQRDNTEHLLLLSLNQDIVVEAHLNANHTAPSKTRSNV